MPNETAKPFDKTTRSGADPELVAGVLGTRAREEMEELVDGQPKPSDQQEEGQFELSADELADYNEAGKSLEEWRRDHYYEWAESIGEGNDWVDETFIFESDGKVMVEGNLDLRDRGISELPPGLYRVEGKLNLGYNNFTKIENIPEAVTELYMFENQISKVENIPESVKTLGLSHNQITKMENFPSSLKKIDLRDNQISQIYLPQSVESASLGGNPIESIYNLAGRRFSFLGLKGIKAKEIPPNFYVVNVVLDPSQTELMEQFRKRGSIVSDK